MKHSPPSKPRILVVDDLPSIHEDFRQILHAVERDPLAGIEADLFGDSLEPEPAEPERMQFELESAYQGQEALARVKAALHQGEPFSVAFVDMRMPPGWNGLETIEQSWRVDPELPMVICTAFSDFSWEEIVERLGRPDRLLFLRKPFEAHQVRELAASLAASTQERRSRGLGAA